MLTPPKQLAFYSKRHERELSRELEFLNLRVLQKTKLLFGLKDDFFEPVWAQCCWRDVKAIEFSSITDAQKKLKDISKKWRYYGDLYYRRGELISEKLDLFLETKKFDFPPSNKNLQKMPPAFTLLEPNIILYSSQISRPTLNGEIQFNEDKINPPSRAYLKLWEALTILNDWPKKSEKVVDLGSSPGSWSWALAKLEANVLSIDRSGLHESLSAFGNIHFKTGDAFSLQPQKMDWVFSDVICYPEKLLDYVQTWLASGFCEKFVCSIKFAGIPRFEIIQKFKEIPHSRVLHLAHNKNEVTWISHPKLL